MIALNQHDRQSEVWYRIAESLRTRIEDLRTDLEKTKDFDETNRLRGRLAEVRGILIAGDEPPFQEEPVLGQF